MRHCCDDEVLAREIVKVTNDVLALKVERLFLVDGEGFFQLAVEALETAGFASITEAPDEGCTKAQFNV